MLKWACLWLVACCAVATAQNYLMVAMPPYLLYDTFNRYSDGSLSAKQPLVGQSAWGVTGAALPVVVRGQVEVPGNTAGYLFNYMGGFPTSIGTYITLSPGSDPTQKVMTIAISSDNPLTICNVVHFNFGPTGYSLSIRQACGSFDFIQSNNWNTPMNTDGTVYKIQMNTVGNTVTIIGPAGESYAPVTDPRVSQVAGPTAFWEPLASPGGIQSALPQVYAYAQLHAY